jgi:hypothetical protein
MNFIIQRVRKGLNDHRVASHYLIFLGIREFYFVVYNTSMILAS